MEEAAAEPTEKETKQHFKNMLNMQRSGDLHDVTFLTGTTKIRAHRFVLAATSEYFHVMFTSPFAEQRQDQIEIHAIDPETLSLIIEFLYTGQIKITEHNVKGLLPASNMLQIKEVYEECAEFLEHNLRPSNVLGIRDLAELQNCERLLEDAERFIKIYFTDVVQHEEFLQAEPERVLEIVSSNNLTVIREEQVLDAVLAWVKFQQADRLQYLPEFIRHVRLSLISKGNLFAYLSIEDMLKEDSCCKEQIVKAANLSAEQKKLLNPKLIRHPEGQPQKLFVFSGTTLTASIKVFDFAEHKWTRLSAMKVTRTRAQLVLLNEELYVLGGIRGESLKTVRVFDFLTNSWKPEKTMRANRANFAACAFMGKVFACGGMWNDVLLNSAEVFDIRQERCWNLIANMETGRAYHAVAVMEDKVYAVGGCHNGQVLRSVEYYDSVRDKWFPVTPMNTRRSGAVAGVLDGRLYVTGGWDGMLFHDTCEVYNPSKRTWAFVSPMIKTRRNPGSVVYNGRLFVIGGDGSGGENQTTMEVYDPRFDRWNLLPCVMDYNSRFTSAVAKG